MAHSRFWWFGVNNTRRAASSGHVHYENIAPFLLGKTASFEWPFGGAPSSVRLYEEMCPGDKVVFWMGDGVHKEWGIIGFGVIAELRAVRQERAAVGQSMVILKRLEQKIRRITPYPAGKPSHTEETTYLRKLFGSSFRPLRKMYVRLGYQDVKPYVVTVDRITGQQFQALIERARLPEYEASSSGDKRGTLPGAGEWRNQVYAWATKRKFGQRDTGALVAYFERAFSNTRCGERAWFGTHSSRISLVVGGIFLAAVMDRSTKDHGLWLLLDADALQLDGIEYSPVKPTRKSVYKLRWAHASSIDILGPIISNDALWESFSRASEKILSAPIAADRDGVQQRRGKIRLADFWPEDDNDASMATSVSDDPVIPVTRAIEGEMYFRLSRHRRRERVLRDAKIEEVRKRTPGQRLQCEVPGCGFDFEERYGEIGRGFAHVHHIDQLSELESPREVTLANLVVVCANCHAMIHHGGKNRPLAGLVRVT